MFKNESGEIVSVPEDRRIHRILWLRTLEIAFFVTLFCFLMAYPIAHLLATLPMSYRICHQNPNPLKKEITKNK
jgi:putative spermidine/putrescine transport system permease protein